MFFRNSPSLLIFMKIFKDYFKDEDIIFYLCRTRATLAKQRNKKHLIHLLTGDDYFNYHKNDSNKLSDYEKRFQADIDKLLPTRRKWKDLGEKSRYKRDSKQKISSVDKNIYSLIKTVKYYRKEKPTEGFVLNLNSFIKEIKETIQDSNYTISSPTIYPKPKNKKRPEELEDDDKNTCRPISLFNLKDRIILSITNKYLTKLFDPYFDKCSLAFRAVNKVGDEKVVISHHNAIQEIVKYKSAYKETPLWVGECDMKKFYDSVNHRIIVEHFDSLIKKVSEDNQDIDTCIPQRIFYKYLECYCFNKDVKGLNRDDKYWEQYKIARGEFGWVEKEFEKLKYYTDIDQERIGIPQGGALSGLIANIVLDSADKNVIRNPDLFYVRFCDDMILMHPNKDECQKGIDIYKSTLKELELVPHEHSTTLKCKREKPLRKLAPVSLAPFWEPNSKSKGPYKWDDVNNDGFPWIGFVGYEIHHKGFIRVRKSSLEKQLKKQHEVIKQISTAIKQDKRASNGTIAESVIHRLIGMSVGRVEIWNYSEIENEMCWKNGFQELNKNKYSINQLKQLDRTRSKLYYKLIKDLDKLEEEERENEKPAEKTKSRQIIDYNKPFSYYYQIAERLNSDK